MLDLKTNKGKAIFIILILSLSFGFFLIFTFKWLIPVLFLGEKISCSDNTAIHCEDIYLRVVQEKTTNGPIESQEKLEFTGSLLPTIDKVTNLTLSYGEVGEKQEVGLAHCKKDSLSTSNGFLTAKFTCLGIFTDKTPITLLGNIEYERNGQLVNETFGLIFVK